MPEASDLLESETQDAVPMESNPAVGAAHSPPIAVDAQTPALVRPRENIGWKRPLAYSAAAAAALAAVLATAYALQPSGKKTEKKIEAPSGSFESDTARTRAKLEEIAFHRRRAEEALNLSYFYTQNGDTEKLRQCLATMRRWRDMHLQMHGVPAEGLAGMHAHEAIVERDVWERVNNAITDLEATLD